MNSDTIWMLLRSVLYVAMGSLITKGLLTEDQLNGFLGALGVIFLGAWQVYLRWNTRIVSETTAQRVDVPTVSAATGATITGPSYTGNK